MGESDRLRCCVPFCRRTCRAGEFSEWVCGKHWGAVSPALRGSYAAERRLVRRIVRRKPLYAEYWKYPGGSSDRLAAVAMWRRLDQLWTECRDNAIQTAAGL